MSSATNPTSVITTISNGMCFTSHGGIYNNNDVTFYQLRDDKNGQTAWIDSFYLSIEPMDHCNASAVLKGLNYHVPDGPPADCVAYGRTYTHGEQATVDGAACTCDDGVLTCSLSGQHCFSDGLVFQHGTSFDITGHGTCTCSHGTLNCGGLPVGK
ncbi:hypothetical protein MAR_010899 [Mya arenaria]|uniref:Uncharacterized protein n=1 Tax=Mya arenaria TaxID=6604 RepID=A0ABY7FSI7_MYAAR|nr:hypothetical protein MAR_010899 [Mya arenaria]